MLRSRLDERGYSHVQVVGGDAASWQIVDDVLRDPQLAYAVDIIG